MKFQRPNGGVLQLDATSVGTFTEFKQLTNGTPESGGILLGRLIANSNDIIIDRASMPDLKDRRFRFSFFRRKAPAQRIVDQAWLHSNATCNYLGEWHTHPEDIPTPSPIDINNWFKLARKTVCELECFFFIIVGRKEIKVWELNKSIGHLGLLPELTI